ncbi:MAG: acetylglutamate kinase [Sphingobacteriaceae bacterium]
MKSLTIVKIGGNVIDHRANLAEFLIQFASVKGAKILVHGGGKLATQLSDRLGIEAQLIDGRRITDAESLRIVTMVYAGIINKNIVAQLQALKQNAIGLSGADANLICAKKRPVKEIDYGFVGDLDESSVSAEGLKNILEQGLIPVFSAITHNGEGQLLNTNADTIAAALAAAMAPHYETSLVYCFEKKGVLRDVNDEESVIKTIDPESYNNLKNQGAIHSGMLPKLDNAFDTLRKGVKEVYIGKADKLNLLTTHNFGTRIHITT